jgi:hypothetical protein
LAGRKKLSVKQTSNQRKKIIMSKKSLFCIAFSRQQAELIVEQVKNANFSHNDISALFADKDTGEASAPRDIKTAELLPKAA